jgi:ABC-type uncharacterized transport system permease subunit
VNPLPACGFIRRPAEYGSAGIARGNCRCFLPASERRYVYAIGGNPEAARRAGISLMSVRTWCFILCSLTAGIAGLLYASYLGGMSNNVNGGQLVLSAVAAAVIGGTSLFGGRGKPIHGVLGGLVIGGIYNGMYLLGLAVQWESSSPASCSWWRWPSTRSLAAVPPPALRAG